MFNSKIIFRLIFWICLITILFAVCKAGCNYITEKDNNIVKFIKRSDSLNTVVRGKDSIINNMWNEFGKKDNELDTLQTQLNKVRIAYNSTTVQQTQERKKLIDSIKTIRQKIETLSNDRELMNDYFTSILKNYDILYIKSVDSLVAYDDPPDGKNYIVQTTKGAEVTRISLTYNLSKTINETDSIIPQFFFNGIPSKGDIKFNVLRKGTSIKIDYNFSKGTIAKGVCKLGFKYFERTRNINSYLYHPKAQIVFN